MKNFISAVYFLLGALMATATNPETPQITCNLTTEFALELAECVFEPFMSLIPKPKSASFDSDDIDFHPFTKYRMGEQAHILNDLRKSQFAADTLQAVGGFEQTEYDKIRDRLNPGSSSKNVKNEVEKVKVYLRQHVLKEILQNVDFDEVADHVLERLLGTSFALRDSLMEFAIDQHLILPEDWDKLVKRLCNLGISRLCKMGNCLPAYGEEQFEDSLTFARCFFLPRTENGLFGRAKGRADIQIITCRDIPAISGCMHNAFEGCQARLLFKLVNINLDWVGDLITRVLVDFLEIDTVEVDGYLELTEGLRPGELHITSLVPPSVHCFSKVNFMNTPVGVAELLVQFLYGNMGKCDVELQVSTTSYIRQLVSMRIPDFNVVLIKLEQSVMQSPVCRSGKDIPRLVIAWHEHANESAGVIPLTHENWNETFIVPVVATIDNKIDLQNASKVFLGDHLSVRVKAGLIVKDKSNVMIWRINKDEMKFTSCWVINGPHTRTFDGHYYNNLYEGHFLMYRNKNLPYEVQIVNQRCSDESEEVCTCAASVRSGDDVFSVDRCRRNNQTQENVKKTVTLYLVDDLTPGTKIFRHDEGLTYKVLLPHGTLVTISSTGPRLNVYIRPSAYDRCVKYTLSYDRRVEGLCGDYCKNSDDDFRLRDGSLYTGDTTERMQPRGFIKDWRVTNEDEIILRGYNSSVIYPKEVRDLVEYCSCSHIVIVGVQCTCGHDKLVSDCDIDEAGQLPELFPMIARGSEPEFFSDRPELEVKDVIDFHENYTTIDTEDHDWDPDNDTIAFCDELISNDPVLVKCKGMVNDSNVAPSLVWDPEFINYKFACQEDILLTNSTDWSTSSRMAARQHCFDLLSLTSYYNSAQIKGLTDLDCPNDCSPHLNNASACVNGMCICDDLHKGTDCSLLVEDGPSIAMPESSPCDTRNQNCSYATIYGMNFATDSVYCHVIETGESLPTHVLTENQISCKLPDTMGRPVLGVTTKAPPPPVTTPVAAVYNEKRTPEVSASDSFNFVAYDSLCFDFMSDGTVQRRQVNDHCLIDNTGCYQTNQTSDDDECYVCYPEESMDSLLYSKSEPCQEKLRLEEAERHAQRKERNLRIVFSCLLCGAVVLITIILFFVSRSKSKKREKTGQNGDVPNQINHTYEMNSSVPDNEHIYSTPTEDAPDGVDNPALESTTKVTSPNGDIPGNPGNAPGDLNTREMAEFWHIKHLAAQHARTRTNSQGSRASSMGSAGIGGSGPSHFGQSRLRSSTSGSYGMGASTHLGRIARRAPSGGTEDDDGMESMPIGGGGSLSGTVVRL